MFLRPYFIKKYRQSFFILYNNYTIFFYKSQLRESIKLVKPAQTGINNPNYQGGFPGTQSSAARHLL